MNLETILDIVTPVATRDEEAVRKWSEQERLFSLLEEQRSGDWILLYGSSFNLGSFFLRSILVPLQELAEMTQEDLTSWDNGSIGDSSSCGLVTGGGKPPRVEFHVRRLRMGSRNVRRAVQLVFGRSFKGRREDKWYFEISSFITHAHGLHWTPERRAWCRFDQNGDIEDVIKLAEKEGRAGYGEATSIVIRRDVIEMHMSATNTALVQLFDSTCTTESFHGWANQEQVVVNDPTKGLHYRLHSEEMQGGYARGIQIIRPSRTAEQYGKYLQDRENQPKQYESFTTLDWKNDKLVVMSCDPAAMASYFEKNSDLPFQTSPVFFNAAVLDKYRSDTEKYSIDHRSITCRNSWHLQTYDVNDAGQVHTYIKYLGDLPHSEQIYWRAFNEEPKGPISKRAYTTDFEGDIDQEPDTLRDLQRLLNEIHADGSVKWFSVREPDLINQLHYPLTDSVKIWTDILTTLAKLVNEGLERKYFESSAKGLGSKGDPAWGSILWARESLRARGVSDEVISETIDPLRDLQHLRSSLGGSHSSGSEANAIRAALLRKFGSPRDHIFNLAGQLVQSLEKLRELNRS